MYPMMTVRNAFFKDNIAQIYVFKMENLFIPAWMYHILIFY